MNLIKKIAIISVYGLFFLHLGCAKKVQAASGEVNATAYAPAIPVLKGMELNPLLRIGIFIPANLPQHYLGGTWCARRIVGQPESSILPRWCGRLAEVWRQ